MSQKHNSAHSNKPLTCSAAVRKPEISVCLKGALGVDFHLLPAGPEEARAPCRPAGPERRRKEPCNSWAGWSAAPGSQTHP